MQLLNFQDPDPASSVVSGHTTFCRTGRTPVAMETSLSAVQTRLLALKHIAGGKLSATRLQSNKVSSFLKADVSHFSKIHIVTTPHLTHKLAQQPALPAASTNTQLQELSSRDHHAGSKPFGTLPQTNTQCTVSISFGCSYAERMKRNYLNFVSFPIHQLSHSRR